MAHHAGAGERGWLAPVLKTAAVKGEGVPALWRAVEEHGRLLLEGRSEYYRRLSRLKARIGLLEIVKGRVMDEITRRVDETGTMDAFLEELLNRRSDPYTVSEKILRLVMAQFAATPDGASPNDS
jgi:LAO/AO transport system kinase